MPAQKLGKESATKKQKPEGATTQNKTLCESVPLPTPIEHPSREARQGPAPHKTGQNPHRTVPPPLTPVRVPAATPGGGSPAHSVA